MTTEDYLRANYATLLDQQVYMTALAKEERDTTREDAVRFQQELAAAELDRDAAQESADQWQDWYDDEYQRRIDLETTSRVERDQYLAILWSLGRDNNGYDASLGYDEFNFSEFAHGTV